MASLSFTDQTLKWSIDQGGQLAEELKARESREGGSLGRDQIVFTEGRTESWEADGKMRATC